MVCPNRNLKEWKALENKYGYAGAMAMYELNGEEIPSLEDAARMEQNVVNGQGVYDVIPSDDLDMSPETAGLQGGRFQVGAWHGSPYQFDKFTTEKIGTGEGAQAFGWGLYFTDLDGVARDYAERLSRIKGYILDGEKLPSQVSYEIAQKQSFNTGNELLRKVNNILNENGFREINNIDELKPDLTRNLYKVTLHKGKKPSEYTWLEWDKPLSKEQKSAIINQAKKEGFYDELIERVSKRALEEDYDGQFWYGNISSALGMMGVEMDMMDRGRRLKNDKEASLFLLRAGIDGIKYPAESIARGATSDTARGFNYVVFDENAVEIEQAIRFQQSGKSLNDIVVDGWYSPIEKRLLETKVEKQSANKWLTGGVIGKGDEAVWTGVKAWLESKNPQEQVSKSEIQQWMKDNRISVVEVVKGAIPKYTVRNGNLTFDNFESSFEVRLQDGKWRVYDPMQEKDVAKFENVEDAVKYVSENDAQYSVGDSSKFSQYQLEGEKSNYKEVLVTLPPKKREGIKYEVRELNGGFSVWNNVSNQFESLVGVVSKEEAQKRANKANEIGQDSNYDRKDVFQSTHYDEPNILVHLRMNTRTDANGNKVLFLEEIQSDWGQKGKKEGFGESKTKYQETLQKYLDKYGYDTEEELVDAKVLLRTEQNELDRVASDKGIPSAPFVTDTNAWVKLALKVAIKEAVAQGADKIAWSTGTQQFDRWGTEKIDWVKRPDFNQQEYDKLREKIKNDIATNDEIDRFQELTKSKKGGWKISIQEQFEGTAFEGMNIDEKALSEKGISITSKEDLKEAIDRNLSREKTETERQKLTDRIWERMQTEDSGTSLPRKEGMESFYGVPSEKNLGIVGQVAKSLTKQEIGKVKIKTKNSEGKEIESTQSSIDITPELKAEVAAGMPRFQIIGEVGAENLPNIKANLQVARDMESAGKTPKEIYLATGWERTKDKGKWKYDLPDVEPINLKSTAQFGPKLLSDVVKNEQLFAAYPFLRDIKINILPNLYPGQEGYRVTGSFNLENNNISINYEEHRNPLGNNDFKKTEQLRADNENKIKSAIIHEIQHAIQKKEGFSQGGSVDFSGFETDSERAIKYKKYRSVAGEVEARNAQTRAEMTPEQRKEKMLSETEDVEEDSKIYIYGTNAVSELQFQDQTEQAPPLYPPISVAAQNYIQSLLAKVFPRVKVKFLSQQEYEAKFNRNTNAAVGTDGIVYLNAAKVNITTQVHEFAHVWASWAKKYAPKLYQEGLRLAVSDPDLVRQVQELNPGLTGSALAEECLATIIGNKGGEMLMQKDAVLEASGKQTISQYLKKLWNAVKNFFNKNHGVTIRGDMENMNIGDFASQVAGQLLSGQFLSDITSEEIKLIEQDIGIQRNQVSSAYKGRIVVEQVPNSVPIVRPSYLRIKDNIVLNLMDAINQERAKMQARGQTLTNGEIRKYKIGGQIIRKQINQNIESIKKMLGDRGWGEKGNDPKHKAFTKDLVKLQGEINTGAKDDDLQMIADQIMSGNFDPQTLPPTAQRFVNAYVRTMQQAQFIAMNGGDIALSENEKVTAAQASQMLQDEVNQFRYKWNAIKGANKYLGAVLDFAEARLRDIANGQLWVKMMAGSTDGIIQKLSNSLTRAGGLEKLHIGNANEILRPLFEKDWFKAGSQTINPNAKLSELETVEIQGVKLTTEEAFDVFMKFQQNSVREKVLRPTKDNPNPTADIYVPEFGTERAGQVIKMTRADYDTLFAKFDQYWDDVRTTWYPTSEYMLEEVNRSYELEFGIELGRSVRHLPNQRWNIYYPLVHGEGKDAIKTYMQKNRFLNDIGSMMYRDADDDTPYLAGQAAKIMGGYIAQNARYAAYAMPIKNMDTLMKNNEEFLRQNKMESYIEWWNEQKAHIYNGDTADQGIVNDSALLKGFVYSRLGLNPFVFLKQFTSVPLATINIKTKYVMAAQKDLFGTLIGEIKNYDMFTDWIGRSKQVNALKQEMMVHSPYAYGRMMGGTSEAQLYIQDSLLDQFPIKIQGKPVSKSDLLKYINSADTATGTMVWSAAKMQVENEYGIQSGDPRYWQKVEDIYMKTIVEIQSSNDEWQRSSFAKRGGILNKSLSLFAGQSFSNFNGFMGRVIDVIDNPDPIAKLKLFKSFAHIFVTSAIMTASVDALRYGLLNAEPEDDEEKEKEFFFQALARGMYGNIPVLSPIIDAAVNKYNNPIFGRDLSHPALETMNNGAEAIANAAKGRESKAISELVRFTAGVTGVPMIGVIAAEKIIEK